MVIINIYYVCRDGDVKPVPSSGRRPRKKTLFLMEISFKSKVRERLIEGVLAYSKLLNYFFVFESRQFQFQKSYSLRFTEDNYKHLTGVTTKFSARVFFDKCLNGTIKIDDFDCEDSKRRKRIG